MILRLCRIMSSARKPSTILRLAALLFVAGIAGALTLGHLGWLHWAFDSFSHLRLHLAALLLLVVPVLLGLRLRIEAFAAFCFAAATAAVTLGFVGPGGLGAHTITVAADDPAPRYRLLHMNLRHDNPTPERGLSLIGQLRPDVVTLTEVSQMWEDRLSRLRSAYPFQIVCEPPTPIGGVAILSRRPFVQDTEAECHDRGALALASIDIAGREVDVAALHVGWPWPFAQPWQLPNLEPFLARIDETAILAGDLNSVPWSQSARRLEAMSGLTLLRSAGPTYAPQMLPDWLRSTVGLPIDHVMVGGDVMPIELDHAPSFGSDHLPLLLEFTLPPAEPSQQQQFAQR